MEMLLAALLAFFGFGHADAPVPASQPTYSASLTADTGGDTTCPEGDAECLMRTKKKGVYY